MSSITPYEAAAAAILKSLEKRITALSMKIATDRANLRERLPLNYTTWKRENRWTADLERYQIELERLWIKIQDATLDYKMVWVDEVEKRYADRIGNWRTNGMF
ncbi:hypothetical protein COCVIDRAFT_110498 [Bipolaris victoriae FI3]|uniref:Uncharacterized protein n=1 Tax=Bipolaris victoriae (strain FI3) TaxID=930091 RepID=W7E6Q5_BIPV3|nr:hypothetical protein COCVIDRAFT_110498 [Bipolaris victoriae FI3]